MTELLEWGSLFVQVFGRQHGFSFPSKLYSKGEILFFLQSSGIGTPLHDWFIVPKIVEAFHAIYGLSSYSYGIHTAFENWNM